MLPADRPVDQNAAPEPTDSPSASRSPVAADSPASAAQPPVAGEVDATNEPAASPDCAIPGEAGIGGETTAPEETPPDAEELPPSESLAEAVGRLGLDISPDKIAKLDEYCQRLWELNQHINLTRHTTYDLFVRRDLLDTYELAKFIEEGQEVLDVGTGGGVPGIPLAILRPDLKVSLCDSVGKKARAAETLVSQLKLPIYVHAMPVQDVLEDHSFDTLVTRAVGSVSQLCNWLKDYWHCFNRLLAIKGPRWVEERKEARHRGVLHGTVLRRIHGYRMPGTKSESVILQLHRPRPGSAA